MYIIKTPLPGHELYYEDHIPAAEGNDDIIQLTTDINRAKVFSKKEPYFNFDILGDYYLVDGLHESHMYKSYDDPIRDYVVSIARNSGVFHAATLAVLLGWQYIKIERETKIIEEDE